MDSTLSLSLSLIDTVLIAIMLGFLLRTERDREREHLPDGREGASAETPDEPAKHARFERVAQFEVLTNMNLTLQEIRVAKLILEGKSNHEISQEVGVSVRTVQHHARQAMLRTGASSRKDFAAKVRQAAEQLVDGEGESAAASQVREDGRDQAQRSAGRQAAVRARR